VDRKSQVLITCLLAAVVSMLATGLVTGAVGRYAIQAIPASLLLVAVMARRPWVAHAVIGVFLVSGALMLAFWARVWTGRTGYVSAQPTLSVVLVSACLIGCVAAGRGEPKSLWGRLGVFSVWAIAQVAIQVQTFV
jgi:hypothetical protein